MVHDVSQLCIPWAPISSAVAPLHQLQHLHSPCRLLRSLEAIFAQLSRNMLHSLPYSSASVLTVHMYICAFMMFDNKIHCTVNVQLAAGTLHVRSLDREV